jgi:hypothetical protein
MKIGIAIFFLGTLYACGNDNHNTNFSSHDTSTVISEVFPMADSTEGYPQQIVKLKLQKLYDKSRWFLYCIYCDKKLSFRDKLQVPDTSITFGELPLNFDHIDIMSDTIEMYFDFYLRGTKIDEGIVENLLYSGTVFTDGKDSIVLYTSRLARYFWAQCLDSNEICPYREVNPLQPDVKKYIQKNKEKIDPWFRAEAVRRGVLK